MGSSRQEWESSCQQPIQSHIWAFFRCHLRIVPSNSAFNRLWFTAVFGHKMKVNNNGCDQDPLSYPEKRESITVKLSWTEYLWPVDQAVCVTKVIHYISLPYMINHGLVLWICPSNFRLPFGTALIGSARVPELYLVIKENEKESGLRGAQLG